MSLTPARTELAQCAQAVRAIAVAPLALKMLTFQREAEALARQVAAGKLPLQETVDALQAAADAHSLPEIYGADEVQGVLADAFKGRPTPEDELALDDELGPLTERNGHERTLLDDAVEQRDAIHAEELEFPPLEALAADLDRHPDDPTAAELSPLAFLDAVAWEGKSVPRQPWFVPGLIPAFDVTLFTGDGGTGKTMLALDLAVAARVNGSWLGHPVNSDKPVLFFTAEEDPAEIHRRLDRILRHRGVGYADIAGLHFCCASGEDTTLASADRNGFVRPTLAYKRLERAIEEARPGLLVIEAAANVLAGNENDRNVVQQFIGLLRHLARKYGLTILLLSHPSLSGRASGTGTSGSTAWVNSVRSHIYLTYPKAESGENGGDAPMPVRRVLKHMKSNYGPLATPILLRWHEDGVFVAEGGQSSLEKIAAEAKVDELFLAFLDRFNAEGRPVGVNPGKNYAPTQFAKEPGIKGVTSHAFAAAMSRLRISKKISLAPVGSASKVKSILIRTNGAGDAIAD
jgi:RecA-family ATPase